jgi:hypothetical protein
MPGLGVTNSYVPDIEATTAALNRIRQKCGKNADGLDGLSRALADPLFQQLLQLENALTKVKKEIKTNPENFPDYKIDANGHLVEEYRNMFE